jgi:hypothetical protein
MGTVKRWGWLAVGLVAITVGVVVDGRVTWFPGFLIGMMLGTILERFDHRRTRGGIPRREETAFPCVDPAYDDPVAAHEGIAERTVGLVLREQPYVYRCVHGHWHASVRAAYRRVL